MDNTSVNLARSGAKSVVFSWSVQVYKLSTDLAEDTALFANSQINREQGVAYSSY